MNSHKNFDNTFQSNLKKLINTLQDFEYTISYSNKIWKIIFPDEKQHWHYLSITQYNETYYLAIVNKQIDSLEFSQKTGLSISKSWGSSAFNEPTTHWEKYILSAQKWLKFTQKNWVKANKQIQQNYPLNYRFGIAPHSIIQSTLLELYRINTKLKKSQINQFVHLVESGYFRKEKNTIRSEMTLETYFEYCKIAYIAAQDKEDSINQKLSGKEMYQRYADGRDNGLLSIEPHSNQAFSDWLDGKHPASSVGGHPWEIKRGGNTTHIDLYVSRPNYNLNENFQVTIHAPALHRLKEAICMFLAIYDAGLPINIIDPEGIRKRLLGQDNIGIIPSYGSLHRANQHFHKHESVYDVMHYDELGRYKQRVNPFITWEPLPVLKPVNF